MINIDVRQTVDSLAFGRAQRCAPGRETFCLRTCKERNKQKQTYLPQIVDGSTTTALALEEGNRHSPLSIHTEAKKDGKNFILTGNKTFVIDGHSSNLLIVAARTSGSENDSSGITLFLVDPSIDGVEVSKTSMVDSRNSANITLNEVIVSLDDVLG